MKRISCYLLFSFIFIYLVKSSAMARPEIAFGYMHNTENDAESGYLETILPNSCANAISAIFDVKIKKPVNLEKELKEKGSLLKKDYELHEIPEVIKIIGSDMFVFGNYEIIKENRIKIVMNIYMKEKNEIFKFTNTGRIETQISRLVDSISVVIINFMNKQTQYKVRSILPGTRIAVITNLNNIEQNIIFSSFLKNGYTISCLRANDIFNIIDDNDINKFRYITTGKNSYEIINYPGNAWFASGSWSGIEHEKSIRDIKELYKKYDPDFYIIKEQVLDGINSVFENKIDILMVIGFSPDRKKSWVRAIDMKEKELVWMYSDIKSNYFTYNPLLNNTEKIIKEMIEEPVNPFKKLDVPLK
jgi:hypothetical protein